MKVEWIPFTAYNFASIDFMVFAKRKKNGMIKFRVKRMTGFPIQESNFAHKIPLDINKQWDKILSE